MKSILFSLALIFTLLLPTFAQARIDIVPQKIVVQPRERSGEMTVLNLYNTTGNFRIELESFRQNEEGIYEILEGPLDPKFDPQKIIRFSPRQFKLEPGGRQKIRLSIRKPADLPEGEYRFHIKALRFANEEEKENTEGTVSVLMNMGVTIPVVIRHGNATSDAKISNAKLYSASQTTQNRPELHLDILREGNASTIGKIEVFWQSSDGTKKQIGLVSNANVFTEIEKRKFKVALSEMPSGTGSILVRYTDEIDKSKVYDEVTIAR